MIKVGLFLVCVASETLQMKPADPPYVHITKNTDLGFKGDPALSTVKLHTSRVMCVLDSWALHREGHGKFEIEDINATLCTHLIIRSVEILTTKDKNGKPKFGLVNRYIHESESDEMFGKAVGLKEENRNLKLILSVGGWNEDVRKFQKISLNPNLLSKFTKDVVKFLKGKELDGLVVEWMWPGVHSLNGTDSDKKGVTGLIASLSKMFKDEKLELGLTLPHRSTTVDVGYDIPALEGNVDYFIITGQNLARKWGPVSGHHSPLLPPTGTTVGGIVKFVLDKKISPLKVILGIPFVGKIFKLEDSRRNGSGLGAPISKEKGIKGAFNKDEEVLNYNEICYDIRYPGNHWTVYEDEEAKVPFMKDREGNWVSFDDTKSVQAKVEFGEKHGLGGYAAWSITNDDFKGNLCGGELNYPLLRTINYVLSKKGSPESESNPTNRHDLDMTTNPTFTQSPKLKPTPPKTTTERNPNSSSGNNISSFVPGILVEEGIPTSESNLGASDRVNITTTKPTVQKSGNESETEAEKTVKMIERTDGGNSVVSYVVVSIVGMTLLLVAVFFLVWRKRRRDEEKGGNKKGLSKLEIRRFKQGCTYGAVKDKRNTIMLQLLKEQENISFCPYDSSLEVPHTEYEIYADEILGSGAYGVVVKGKVRNEVVAVKTMKPLSSKDNVLSLLDEIKVLSNVGKHEHILGLIGANTALLRRGIVYAFVELCSLGSLDNYLKVNRSSFVDLMTNDEFTCEKSKTEDGKDISTGTLVIWAHQISKAMQFLACKKVIHGDLGTKNVRVCSKHLVKISDFGSFRKMYAYCNCIQQKQATFPWRHMSVEVMDNLEFSTKSDVWAFGVTVWEIFSLGGLPYPGTSYTFRFTEDLMGGRRMSKPKYATTELYEKTMLQTWNENPQDRPSFVELCAFLHESVERIAFQQE